MLDLHRHNHHSTFDGFNSATELAIMAKEKGYTSLGTSNHGSTSDLVEHYFACKEQLIKPILGVEAYFQPKFDKDKSRYHLCLFVKDIKGYENLNRAVTEANMDKFYYKPTMDFETLKRFSKGLICTSACVAGFIPQMIHQGKDNVARKALEKFIEIFGDDFYIEIQPYALKNDPNMQENINVKLMEMADEYGVKCIFTSDSHFGDKEQLNTYLKMHEIGGTKYDVQATYGERYMPEIGDFEDRFYKMHKKDFGARTKKLASEMMDNLQEIEDKVEDEILEKLELKLPEFSKQSKSLLKKQIVEGLKLRGKYNKKYMDRCKREYEVIVHHGFEDYFLMVQDYVLWAKNKGIAVGPGRGSVCNCLIAYALQITDVDSIYFNLEFERFLRKDKKKLPDVDLDFETERRHEVLEYLVNRYPGRAVQISSYGMYKVDNLLNDLFKVCGVEEAQEKTRIKSFVRSYFNEDENFDYESMSRTKDFSSINRIYEDILIHFNRLYKKVRYLGTHAAGVAIVGDDIAKYTAIRRYKDAYTSAYDLNDLEKINAIKFDILGLRTMGVVKEMEQLTGESFSYEWLEDEKVYELFRAGSTTGIFQAESSTARKILMDIEADCMEDVLAGSALNRPGPLSLGMPKQYAYNKQNTDEIANSKYYEYTKETYGTVVYQEQISAICRNIGEMTWDSADKMLKIMKSIHNTDEQIKKRKEIRDGLFSEFLTGAKKHGISKQEAEEIFDNITVYSFNKGHTAGYGMITFEQMWFKLYYPEIFWYVTMKYCNKEENLAKYKVEAVNSGSLVFLPHVNYSAQYSLRKVEGQNVIQEGILNIKNVGEKAAMFIQTERKKYGPFADYDDFYDRCKSRTVTTRVISALKEAGALEFDKKTYLKRVTKYNSALYARGIK